MAVPKVFESEYRLCLILWKNEPISAQSSPNSATKNWAGAERRHTPSSSGWATGVLSKPKAPSLLPSSARRRSSLLKWTK